MSFPPAGRVLIETDGGHGGAAPPSSGDRGAITMRVNPDYVRTHVIYRVNQAEYVIHILAVAPQEYVHIYSTRRPTVFIVICPYRSCLD